MKLLARFNAANGGTLTHINLDDKYKYDFPTTWWYVSQLDIPPEFKKELSKHFRMVMQVE